MPQICHMPKLFNVQLHGKFANIHAMYKVVPINDVARITVHGLQQR